MTRIETALARMLGECILRHPTTRGAFWEAVAGDGLAADEVLGSTLAATPTGAALSALVEAAEVYVEMGGPLSDYPRLKERVRAFRAATEETP